MRPAPDLNDMQTFNRERSLSSSSFQFGESRTPRPSMPQPSIPYPSIPHPPIPQPSAAALPTVTTPVAGKSRKMRMVWSTLELEALESGLEMLGWGQWVKIKKLHYEVLKNRDNVALKDKARNEALRRQKENVPLGPYSGCPYITKGL
jgi:hypothetical protein